MASHHIHSPTAGLEKVALRKVTLFEPRMNCDIVWGGSMGQHFTSKNNMDPSIHCCLIAIPGTLQKACIFGKEH